MKYYLGCLKSFINVISHGRVEVSPSPFLIESIKVATSALESEICRKEKQWICVSEKLPEDYESVLAYGKETNGVRWAMYNPNSLIWKDGTITHWMPLPEPPMREEKENENHTDA